MRKKLRKTKCDLLLKYSGSVDDIPLKDKGFLKLNSEDIREIKRVDDGMPTVYGDLFDSLGFNNILENKNHSDILKQMVSLKLLSTIFLMKKCQILLERNKIKLSSERICMELERVQWSIVYDKKSSNSLSYAI